MPTDLPGFLAAVVVAGLAAARATRLVTTDSITDGLRARLAGVSARRPRLGWVETLVSCDWCAGLWVSAGVWAALAVSGPIDAPLVWHAAAVAAVGMVQGTVCGVAASLDG